MVQVCFTQWLALKNDIVTTVVHSHSLLYCGIVLEHKLLHIVATINVHAYIMHKQPI